MLEVGTWAPSAKNGQQWRFTVLTGPAKKGLTDTFRGELEYLERRNGRDRMGSSLGSYDIMEWTPVLVMVWNVREWGWDSEAHSVAVAI